MVCCRSRGYRPGCVFKVCMKDEKMDITIVESMLLIAEVLSIRLINKKYVLFYTLLLISLLIFMFRYQ